jgi:hypothetical protein
MPSEQLKDYVKQYTSLRRRVVRNAVYAVAVSVALALISRTPELSINLSKASQEFVTPGIFHIGYIVVFGQIAIFILVSHFYLSFRDAVSLRERIRSSVDSAQVGPVEDFFLRLPFQPAEALDGKWSRRVATIGVEIGVFLAPIASYVFLMLGYFQLARPGRHEHSIGDLLLGTGGWGSFKPDFGFIGSKEMPYIYGPIQTWVYLLFFIALLWLSYSCLCTLHGFAARPKEAQRTGSLSGKTASPA